MPFSVLIPHSVAEQCYLSEALTWVAVNRFPLAAMVETGEDLRVHKDYTRELIPDVADDEPLSDEECAIAGLPLNPQRVCFESGDYHSDPDAIRRWLRKVTLEEDRKRFEQELIESEKFIVQQAEWDAQYEVFLDLHKTRLFLALREGRVTAFGKQVPRRSFSGSLEVLEQSDWEDLSAIEWSQIPSNFWISTKINWSKCWVEGTQTAYCLILVEFEQLFEQFSPPIQPANGLVKIGNNFAQDSSKTQTSSKTQSRGRPRLDWDAFYLEVARLLHQGALPDKQEAFIAEMQDWCRANWHRDVGRSTLSQKLKPYYDEFIRKPKKDKH